MTRLAALALTLALFLGPAAAWTARPHPHSPLRQAWARQYHRANDLQRRLTVRVVFERKQARDFQRARRLQGDLRSRANDLQRRLIVRVLETRRLREALKRERQARRLSSVDRGVFYAIRLASSAYGVPYEEMVNVARCETGSTFDPASRNSKSTASGIFQFLDSTWNSDGLAGFSVFDQFANALAAARLVVKDGGWTEWSCKPDGSVR